jgi:hypothetical protein
MLHLHGQDMCREAGEVGASGRNMGMLTRIIDQRMTAVEHQLRHNPTSKIEDLLDMDKAQTDELWRLDFESIQSLKGVLPGMWKVPTALLPPCLDELNSDLRRCCRREETRT